MRDAAEGQTLQRNILRCSAGLSRFCCISRCFRYKSNLCRQMQVIRRKVHLAVWARMLPGGRVRRGRRRLRHWGRTPRLQLHGPAAATESAARSASPAAAQGRRCCRCVRRRTGLLPLPSLQLHGPAVAAGRRRTDRSSRFAARVAKDVRSRRIYGRSRMEMSACQR